MRLVPTVVTASIVGVVAGALPAHAQDAEGGRAVFASRCAACHGTEGGGGELGPSIVARIPLRADTDLEAMIREGLPGAGMPSFASLSKTESTNLIAFLRTLRPRAGTGPQRTSVVLADGSSLSGVVLNQSVGEMQILGDDRRAHLLRETTPGRYRTVTSQTGWTTYNGQASGNRYSALTEITADNVARLAPQWVFTLPNVSQGQVTPVVVDGLMYVSAANDLYALDAGSGRQVWNYRRPRTRGLAGVAARGVNRGVAVGGERVFMATDHAHLIALNRASGALLWETEMADWRQNYNGTGAPMVVGDLVIAGIAGGDEGARGFVAAYEQATGKEVWRFWAVPARGEPGSETWKGNAIDHPGAATWMTGSYDAELDTLYWALGNPGPDMIGDDRLGDNQTNDKCGMFTRVDQTWESGKSFMGGTFAAAPEPAQRVLRAIDIQTGKVSWELPQFGNVDSWGGVLATASDLVFFADDSGAFAAADAKSGKRLWSFQTSQVWKASPMTYVFDNRQMLAIASGPNILAFGLPAQ